MLRVGRSMPIRGRIGPAARWAIACPARRDRHSTCAQARAPQGGRTDGLLVSWHRAATELAALHGTKARTNAVVAKHRVEVRILMQRVVWPKRSKAVMNVVDVRDVDVRHVHNVYATAPTAPPRVKPVTRPARQPANMAPTPSPAETHADSETASPSKEGDVCRRPNRVVSRICVDRTRPPNPGIVVNKPAPVVVRRPAPRLIGNPGPAVVRFPDPAAFAVRNPVVTLIRDPDLAVIGNVFPSP